ncbi:MAG TPA: hypothetical protein VFP34_12280 [Microlunatus sp.]|nr:hypothetical protein [Microlunatus sp.]
MFRTGVLLIVAGAFQALEAISAIVNDQYLLVAPRYIYAFDLTAWGWIHLIIGLGLAAIGISLLLGQGWALMAGIAIAAISAVVNFTWLPYSPFWAILLIAIDLRHHLGARLRTRPDQSRVAPRVSGLSIKARIPSNRILRCLHIEAPAHVLQRAGAGVKSASSG